MVEFFSYLKERFSYREVLNTVGGITIIFPRGLYKYILSRTLSSSSLFFSMLYLARFFLEIYMVDESRLAASLVLKEDH